MTLHLALFILTSNLKTSVWPMRVFVYDVNAASCITVDTDLSAVCEVDILQGVVTYTSPVEAFATRIKMESSDQRSFLEPIKGSRRILSD